MCQSVWSVGSIWFTRFVWLVSSNQMHKTDEIDQIDPEGCSAAC